MFSDTNRQLRKLSIYKPMQYRITQKVTTRTRAPRMGRQIVCPECNTTATVYHFAWSGLQCQHCEQMIDKYDWGVKQ